MRLFTAIFLIAGLGMLGGALWWMKSTEDFLGRAQHTTGHVVDFYREWHRDNNPHANGNLSNIYGGTYTYYPVVEYSYNGHAQRFRNPYGSSVPTYPVGAEVNVLYDPQKPTAAKINNFGTLWVGPIILCVLGAIFTLVSLGTGVFGIGQRRKAEWYKANGEPVMANIRGIRQNINLTVNNRHPWVIEADWLDPVTGQTISFSSHYLWEDPTPNIPGKQIRVYTQQSNRSKYWMDTTGIVS